VFKASFFKDTFYFLTSSDDDKTKRFKWLGKTKISSFQSTKTQLKTRIRAKTEAKRKFYNQEECWPRQERKLKSTAERKQHGRHLVDMTPGRHGNGLGISTSRARLLIFHWRIFISATHRVSTFMPGPMIKRVALRPAFSPAGGSEGGGSRQCVKLVLVHLLMQRARQRPHIIHDRQKLAIFNLLMRPHRVLYRAGDNQDQKYEEKIPSNPLSSPYFPLLRSSSLPL